MGATTFDSHIGREFIERALLLARHSDSPAHYTRTYLTAAHQAAARQIAAWMREAGMIVRIDPVGTVIGRYEAARPGAKTLLMGSHFDSVRNGGKFDGVLGILVGVACVAQLNARRERLPVALEVAAFADEEGARFSTSFLASRAMVAPESLAALLDRRDGDGTTLRDAMRTAGLDPARVGAARIDPATLAAYVEVHIEQGPVLLAEGVALGVVTSIASGSRHTVRVRGEAGHAGTVPMAARRDALAAAAEMVLAVEDDARSSAGAVGTVGVLRVKDGTGNVIPGDVEFSVDIRAPADAQRRAVEAAVFAHLDAIAARRRLAIEKARTHEVHAVPCAGWLQEQIAAAIGRCGIAERRLPSGAGHDAMILADITDVGMMFVRCGAGGVSHSPDETVSADDAAAAIRALAEFVRNFHAAA